MRPAQNKSQIWPLAAPLIERSKLYNRLLNTQGFDHLHLRNFVKSLFILNPTKTLYCWTFPIFMFRSMDYTTNTIIIIKRILLAPIITKGQ